MKGIRLFIACILLGSLISIACAPLVTGNWTQYGADSANTSRVEGRAPDIYDEDKLVWSYRGDSDFSSTPALVGDVLIAGNRRGEVMVLETSAHATDAERVIDTYEMNHSIETSIAYDNGMVYVTNSRELYAFELREDNTLKMVWYHHITMLGRSIQTSPVIDDGAVLITESHFDRDINRHIGRLLALDSQHGAIDKEFLWEVNVEGRLKNTPAIDQGRAYLAGDEYNPTLNRYTGFVMCMDLTDGTEIWKRTFDRAIESSPTVHEGFLFVSNSDSTVIAIDKNTGITRWIYEGNGVVSTIFAVHDDRLVFTTSEEIICLKYTFSEATLEWSYDGFTFDIESPPAIMDDTVFLGTGRSVYAFDLYPSDEDRGIQDPVGVSYDRLWIFTDMHGNIVSQVALGDGRIYVGARNNVNLYALGNKPPEVNIIASDLTPKPGETVVFTGVVESSSEIVEYEWYCPVMGILSSSQNFTRSFGEGNYEIMFHAMDEFGEWSREALVEVRVIEEEDSGLPLELIVVILLVVMMGVVFVIYAYRKKKKGGPEVLDKDTDEFRGWGE